MNTAIDKFLQAHARYEALDHFRNECFTPRQREQVHIDIMQAYLEVQYRARVIAGLQFAEGMDFAQVN
jgi:hypothetical protein